MWTKEIILLLIIFPVFFAIFIYELLYYSEVVETEEWLGIKVPPVVKGLLFVKPFTSLIAGLIIVLYLVLTVVG